MRRPWIEAKPLLGAAGYGEAFHTEHVLSARTMKDEGWRFCLLPHPERAGDRPIAFADKASLARAIHRRRRDHGVQLVEIDLTVPGFEPYRHGVSIYTQDDDGQRAAYLGFAYLNGGGRDALKAALFAAEPTVWRG